MVVVEAEVMLDVAEVEDEDDATVGLGLGVSSTSGLTTTSEVTGVTKL